MGYTVEINQNDLWLTIVTRGGISGYDDFLEKAETIIDLVRDAGTRRILLDDRDVRIDLDVLDIIRVAERLDEADFPTLGLRIACLVGNQDHTVFRTVETIYSNRSINFRLFRCRESAIEWLTA
ncbi:hypothetical protein [Pseudodesulfovibrio piezophilus]|uniref:STAS/SEC14 domain-containing protein n=1 Tax=Pseudodesulfovibrio piezophilus (strain DSM 21447 / JCM 15486 / C1TLV30) TaxID=1322246 RepID=M1WLR8_PSEP2|nr:hypothetical protein [Pseudodesulfovibrio piezophilus]CCH48335.1 conserved protein of unknown function [Pseudodesulfovibrio piezophilus C1TLV30]